VEVSSLEIEGGLLKEERYKEELLNNSPTREGA
jgi:hypothetical protein